MRTIYSPDQLLHAPRTEFHRGELVPGFECPQRAENVLTAVRAAGLAIEAPASFDDEQHLLRVHQPEFIEFLRTAHDQWLALGRDGDALPATWPVRGARPDRIPVELDGKLGFFSCDMATPITAGTWRTTRAAADTATSGAQLLCTGVEKTVFALCRPPGHHASRNVYGGYCYLNNAAIATQYLGDHGASRIAILDVDYHHGNGTQQIFYDRSDVLFASIHADPATDYPYFLGHDDETGIGEGTGCNVNFPLPRGTGWQSYSEALDAACQRIEDFAPDTLVLSLGVDTSENDPISAFRLNTEDYRGLGQRIARLDLPTLIVLEGGYALDDIGAHVVAVLGAFSGPG